MIQKSGKKLLLFLLSGMTLAGAKAQVQFGVKAGANFSTFTGDIQGAKTHVGFHGGILVKIPASQLFSIQPELVYSGQGAKGTATGTSDGGALTANYLNIPILLKYNNPSGFFLETGPQIGFLVSSSAKSGGVSVSAKQFFNSSDFSWAFGLGFLTTADVGFNFRYNLGLSNIWKGDLTQGGTVKNSVIQLGLFYLFSDTKYKKKK